MSLTMPAFTRREMKSTIISTENGLCFTLIFVVSIICQNPARVDTLFLINYKKENVPLHHSLNPIAIIGQGTRCNKIAPYKSWFSINNVDSRSLFDIIFKSLVIMTQNGESIATLKVMKICVM